MVTPIGKSAGFVAINSTVGTADIRSYGYETGAHVENSSVDQMKLDAESREVALTRLQTEALTAFRAEVLAHAADLPAVTLKELLVAGQALGGTDHQHALTKLQAFAAKFGGQALGAAIAYLLKSHIGL